MVQARAGEWADVADVAHVLVEADRTFTGMAKPLLSTRLGPVARLERHTVALAEHAASAWQREWAQRDAIYTAVAALDPGPDDLLLLCDADEIVRSDSLDRILEATIEGPATLTADCYIYDLHHRLAGPWPHPQALRWRDARPDLSSIRQSAGLVTVRDAAWHFSYFGGPRRIGRKLLSFSHTEYAGAEFSDPEATEARIAAGIHVTGHRLIEGDWPLPAHIVEALTPVESSRVESVR